MITHWFLAARPKTLLVSICPVIFGLFASFSSPSFNWVIAVLTFFATGFIQIGTNFANDYFDCKKGADTNQRLGPTRFTQAGLISLNHMKFATYFSFLIAFIIGLILSAYGGWPIFIIGVFAICCGYFYTAGPYALAYIGGAEIVSFLFFGPISVCGTIYLQTFQLLFLDCIVGVGFGCISAALLVINNTRDIDTDCIANKRTFAVRFGRFFSFIEFLTLMLIPVFILFFIGNLSFPLLFFNGCFGFFSLVIIWMFYRSSGSQFNRLLSYIALYLFFFTILCVYFL